MFKFIEEISGRVEHEPSYYLSLWFPYLMKPIQGLAGGIIFFMLDDVGLVTLLAGDASNLAAGRILITAAIGGYSFEDSFKWAHEVISRAPSGTRHTRSINPSEAVDLGGKPNGESQNSSKSPRNGQTPFPVMESVYWRHLRPSYRLGHEKLWAKTQGRVFVNHPYRRPSAISGASPSPRLLPQVLATKS